MQPGHPVRRRLAGGHLRRAVVAAGTVLLGITWAAHGVAAAGGFPAPGSPYQAAVERFFFLTLVFATLLTLVVLVLLVVLMRRRAAAEDAAADAVADWAMASTPRRLVITTYILVPALVIGGLGVVSLDLLATRESVPEADLTLTVRAVQFAWYADYPDGTTTLNEIHVREGDVTILRLMSADVIHSIHVPSLGVKQDVVPGHTATVWFEATGTGTHAGRCAEFCGVGHPEMTFDIIVHPASAAVPP